MVSEKFRIELKKLQSRALPFDNDYALSLIEKELGAPIDRNILRVQYDAAGRRVDRTKSTREGSARETK